MCKTICPFHRSNYDKWDTDDTDFQSQIYQKKILLNLCLKICVICVPSHPNIQKLIKMKKILIGFFALVVLLLAAAVAIPYFFKDEIFAAAKKAANENLNAKVEFSDVDISLFRNFPKLSVGLENLLVSGVGEFEGTNLIRCERLDLAVDFWSALSNDLVVRGLSLQKPDIHVFVLKNGKANYDITKPEPVGTKPAETSTASTTKLEKYEIIDGSIIYDDRSLEMIAEMQELNHSGSGDLYTDLYDMVMKTDIGKLSVNYGGVQYLKNAHAIWDAVLSADMKNMKFTLKENELKINDLEVKVDGWTALPNDDDILMDMKFSTPTNTFKSLLSIVPGAYTKDFSGVDAKGTVQFDGFFKGKYNEKTYPAFALNFKIGDASFKYPALPLGVSGINVDAKINSPSTNLNAMTVAIPKFALKIGSNPLDGYFNLKTPETDPTVDMKLNGTLNLAELTKAFPVEDVQELSGIFKANLTMKAAQSQIEKQLYDQVQMAGSLGMENLNYRSTGTPAVKINSMAMTFSPQFVDIQKFDAKLGKSDLQADGRVDNILAYFSTEKTMTGKVNFTSNYFDANEWMTAPASGGTAATAGKIPVDKEPAPTEKAFDRWDFTVDGNMKRVKYDVYDLSDLAMAGHFTPNKMDVSNFGLKIGQSDISGNGQILNAWKYLFENQTVAGKINLNSQFFDLNQFMEEPPKTATTTAAPPVEEIIPVPENMDMTINAKMSKVLYTNLTLQNLDGAVIVKDRVAKLQDCTADVVGGKIGLTGEYDTRDLAKPKFNMDMAMQNMGFKEAYTNFATIKTFAPIAQLMDGKFNTSISLSGLLGKDMMPDFKTLSAAGFVETISAILNNFKPANQIGDMLNLAYLKKMELKNTKNWFEIKDGTVVVKPFDVQMKDVAMKIGGTSSLNQDMNFQIVTKTPRSAMQKSTVGAAANSGLDFLSKEASKYGVSLAQGEFINVRFDLGGSLFNPKVSMKILGSDGERTVKDEAVATAGAVVEKAKDSLKTVANKELDKAKEKANAAADKIRDSLQRIADKKIEEGKKKAEELAKQKAGEVLGKEVGDKVGEKVGEKIGEKAGEVGGDKGKKTVDEAKEKLKDWDPFKKKKKEGGR